MKRISRSLLSLCLAFVLCAALLPNVNVAKGCRVRARRQQWREPALWSQVTDVSSSQHSQRATRVDITVYLYRTANGTDSDSIRVDSRY